MDYKEAYSYISSFVNYEKAPGIKDDLSSHGLRRVKVLMFLLGNPHENFQSIVIAGTKGKGSVAAMMESVLREAGHKTGLYTSPHLHTFRERIRVRGEMIPPHSVGRIADRVKQVVEEIERLQDPALMPTYYELATAIAFLYFREMGVDIAVLEVGLGGRLDAVNIVNPLVSVITSISLDHMTILGNTIAEIAAEKAGIIKEEGHVISAPQPQEAMSVISRVASEKRAGLTRVGREVYLGSGNLPEVVLDEDGLPTHQTFSVGFASQGDQPGPRIKLRLPLMGNHQQVNAAVAVSALLALNEAGIRLDKDAITRGFSHVSWPGRLEIIHRKPIVVADGAHNADSMSKLNQAMYDIFYKQPLIVVLGIFQDKDLAGIINEMGTDRSNVFGPYIERVLVTRPNHPRAAPPEKIAELIEAHGLEAEVHEDIAGALRRAEEIASQIEGKGENAPVVLVTGSLYTVAEAREYYGLAPDLSEERADA